MNIEKLEQRVKELEARVKELESQMADRNREIKSLYRATSHTFIIGGRAR